MSIQDKELLSAMTASVISGQKEYDARQEKRAAEKLRRSQLFATNENNQNEEEQLAIVLELSRRAEEERLARANTLAAGNLTEEEQLANALALSCISDKQEREHRRIMDSVLNESLYASLTHEGKTEYKCQEIGSADSTAAQGPQPSRDVLQEYKEEKDNKEITPSSIIGNWIDRTMTILSRDSSSDSRDIRERWYDVSAYYPDEVTDRALCNWLESIWLSNHAAFANAKHIRQFAGGRTDVCIWMRPSHVGLDSDYTPYTIVETLDRMKKEYAVVRGKTRGEYIHINPDNVTESGVRIYVYGAFDK